MTHVDRDSIREASPTASLRWNDGTLEQLFIIFGPDDRDWSNEALVEIGKEWRAIPIHVPQADVRDGKLTESFLRRNPQLACYRW